jgi:hypothetical protein
MDRERDLRTSKDLGQDRATEPRAEDRQASPFGIAILDITGVVTTASPRTIKIP